MDMDMRCTCFPSSLSGRIDIWALDKGGGQVGGRCHRPAGTWSKGSGSGRVVMVVRLNRVIILINYQLYAERYRDRLMHRRRVVGHCIVHLMSLGARRTATGKSIKTYGGNR